MILIVFFVDIIGKLVYFVIFKSVVYFKMSYLLNKCFFFECNWFLNDYFSVFVIKGILFIIFIFLML